MTVEFLFDEAKHEYSLVGGYGGKMVIPSVSKVLKRAGMYDYPFTPKAVAAMDRGTHIHKLTYLYDQKVLGVNDVMDEDQEYLLGYDRFVKDMNFIPEFMEQSFYHPLYLYAGTVDKVGMIHHKDIDCRCQVELKTGSPHPANVVQASAYHKMIAQNGVQIRESFLLYLSKGDYRLMHVGNVDQHFDVFLSALNIIRWKEANGIGRKIVGN